MSLANFGIGVNALAQGLRQGMGLARDVQAYRDEQEIRDTTRQGMKNAQQQRQQDIDSQVSATGGLPQRDDFVGQAATEGFTVGNRKNIATRQEAQQAASRNVDDTMSYFLNDAAPKISQKYIEQGNPQKAEAWNQWTQQRQNQDTMREWADMWTSLNAGDDDAAVQKLGKLYNRMDDGVEFIGHEAQRDDNGNITGFKVNLYDSDDNEERTTNFSMDQIQQMALASNPQALFNREMQLSDQRKAAAAEAAKTQDERAWEARKMQAEAEQKMGLETYRQAGKESLESQKSNNRIREDRATNQGSSKIAEADQVADALVGIGYDDEYVKQVYPRLLGIERQRQSPQERLDGYIETLSKSDVSFSRKSRDEQVRAAQQMMDAVDKAAEQSAPRSQQASRSGGGTQGRNAGQSQGQGLPQGVRPVWDSAQGKIVYK